MKTPLEQLAQVIADHPRSQFNGCDGCFERLTETGSAIPGGPPLAPDQKSAALHEVFGRHDESWHPKHLAEAIASAGWVPNIVDCDLVYQEPFDFAQCNTHDETFALGDTCKFNGRSEADVFFGEAQEQRGRAVELEGQMDFLELGLKLLGITGDQVEAAVDAHDAKMREEYLAGPSH